MVESSDGYDLVIPATEFKARCLKLMDRVKRTRETIVITKHGKVVARLVPPEEEVPELFGCMKGTVKILGDIISPLMPDYEVPDLPPKWEPGPDDPPEE